MPAIPTTDNPSMMNFLGGKLNESSETVDGGGITVRGGQELPSALADSVGDTFVSTLSGIL